MLDLPPVIAAYFETPHDADVEQLARLFAADAHVHDEHNDYRGLDAIRAWRVDTHAKTPFTVRPVSLREQDGKHVVAAEVSGAFPGSPVMLDHSFTLADGRIAALDIR
jgi:SnoaL-like domain